MSKKQAKKAEKEIEQSPYVNKILNDMAWAKAQREALTKQFQDPNQRKKNARKS